jgi:hypothetical protein
MGKHNKQAITASPPRKSSDAIQAQAPAPRLPLLPNQALGLGPWRMVGALVLGIGVPLAVVFAVVWADREQPLRIFGPRPMAEHRMAKDQSWRPSAWEPVSAEDRVIDAFMRLHNTDSPDARALLGHAGKAAEMKDRVLTADEERTLTAEHFLRSDALRVIDVWRGEPDESGAQVARPGRYTLITHGTGSTPPYRLTTSKPGTSPVQQHLNNPDLIVDVRDGKIVGVRADCHRGP